MPNDNSLKSRVLTSLFWKLFERGGTAGSQFLIQIVLARLLLPEDFGLIAIVMVFVALAQVFVAIGFNTALIQKKDADEADFSSVLYLSLAVAAFLYLIIFFGAPAVAWFYQDERLIALLRVISLMLLFGAFNSLQNAYIARHLIFKKQFFSNVGATIISGVAGIFAAYQGLGVWSLVIFYLANQAAITLILWFTVKWRPQFTFSFKRVAPLFAFGWKIAASSLIATLYQNLQTLIIGRMFTPSILGIYDRGKQIPEILVENIDGSIQAVLFPALASQQDNVETVKDMMRRAMRASSYIMFPMMVGLAVVAEPMVKILLTDKWLPSVPFIQIYCASFALWPIHTANLQAITAMGRSDIYLRLTGIKIFMGIIILGVSLLGGIYGIAWGAFVSGILSTFINAYPNKKLIGYNYIEQVKDLFPSLFLSLAMGAVLLPIKLIRLTDWQLLLMQIMVGILVYLGLSVIFKVQIFSYLKLTLGQMIVRKNV